MLPENQQPAERLDRRPDSLEVVKVWETIQGEGPYAGMPAVFVRLAGCNLRCPGCDTDYTSTRTRLSPSRIAEIVSAERSEGLVVITGGEPFRQSLGGLMALLADQGRIVQIETNGTLYDTEFPWGLATIVCSPKAGVNPQLAERVDAWKYVLRAGEVDSEDGLPTSALGLGIRPGRPTGSVPVFVQPMDEQDDNRNARNLAAAVGSCLRFGYRLSIQMHKAARVE